MKGISTDIIVIGGGHAGLSISYQLKNLNLDHILFEKGKIGNSWLSQRWDSFKMNTPNKMNLLPGIENYYPDDDDFCSARDFVDTLEKYSLESGLPVQENSTVLSVEKADNSKSFNVRVSADGSMELYRGKKVIVASGGQNIKSMPPFSGNISSSIVQKHASEYRNATSLPGGAVLVVGSAQSGIQIAEDLVDAGRKVFLSTSEVPRVPRRYRGKDITDWLTMTGFFDLQTKDVTDPKILMTKQPQVSNKGNRGRTTSYQSLWRSGVVILGKAKYAEGQNFYFHPNAGNHVKFADDFSNKVKRMIDDYIQKSNFLVPLPEYDPADEPDNDASCASPIAMMDLRKNNINSIIWCTGFKGDFGYLKLPVFTQDGYPLHFDGLTNITGLYFTGLPWLRKRKSGIIYGSLEDSEILAEHISRL
jgi:putative flavoprotein involved in K+ transport